MFIMFWNEYRSQWLPRGVRKSMTSNVLKDAKKKHECVWDECNQRAEHLRSDRCARMCIPFIFVFGNLGHWPKCYFPASIWVAYLFCLTQYSPKGGVKIQDNRKQQLHHVTAWYIQRTSNPFHLRAVLTDHPLCPLCGWVVLRKREFVNAR